MIVILKKHPDPQKLQALMENFAAQGLKTNYSEGAETTIIGLIGDTSHADIDALRANELVEDVRRVT